MSRKARKARKAKSARPSTAASAPSAEAVPRQQGELASIRRRCAVMIYEIFLLGAVAALCWLLPGVILGMTTGWTLPGWLALLELFLVFGWYFVWYWQRHGQTLPMQTWRLKVVDRASGRNVSTRQAMLRYVLAWASLLACGAGFLWAFIDRDRLFLHDRLSGCCVVLLTPIPR